MVLLRSRSLSYFDKIVGPEPLGKGALDVLGVEFDVNVSA